MQLLCMYYILQFMDYTIYSKVTSLYTTLTRIHSDSHDSNTLTLTTLTCSLEQLWHTCFHFNSDILASTPTETYLLPLQLWHTHFHSNFDMDTFTTDLLSHKTPTYSLSNLSYALSHCSDMVTLTSLKIWLCWEQAGSSGSGFAGRGATSFAGSNGSGFSGSKLVAVAWSLSPLRQSGFAGSKLVAVDLASMVGVNLASLGASWQRWIRDSR